MSRLSWDATGERLYETGVKNGVLYPQSSSGTYPLGVAWNGLTNVSESPTGAEATPIYADNIKYLNLLSTEEFAATIEAFTYPAEFEACDGGVDLATGVAIGQQSRQQFGMCYRTEVGNDVDGEEYGYKLHLIYGALAAPSEKAYQTINDSPEAINFSWEVSTTPVSVTDQKPTASVVIDSTKCDATTLATLEDILYGTEGVDPRLPLPNEIKTLFDGAAPSALALSTIDPADAETDVAIDSAITMTFNNAIVDYNITVTTAAGVPVAGAFSLDSTEKILTFTPTVDLANSTTYLVVIANVADIYAQSLTNQVKDFTTAAA